MSRQYVARSAVSTAWRRATTNHAPGWLEPDVAAARLHSDPFGHRFSGAVFRRPYFSRASVAAGHYSSSESKRAREEISAKGYPNHLKRDSRWGWRFCRASVRLKAVLRCVPDPRKGRSGDIAMADFGLCAFAMFFMQCASFCPSSGRWEKGQGAGTTSPVRHQKIPSENSIRDMLDGADPLCWRLVSSGREDASEPRRATRWAGSADERLSASTGTVYLSSQKIVCPHRQSRKRSNGESRAIIPCLPRPWCAPNSKGVRSRRSSSSSRTAPSRIGNATPSNAGTRRTADA